MFLSGIEMERRGRLYEAIQHYKYSLQILPDVEKRLHNELQAEMPEGKPYQIRKGTSVLCSLRIEIWRVRSDPSIVI